MRSSPSFCDTYFLTHCKSANGITRPPSRLTTKVRPACAPAYVPLSSIAHGRLQRMLGDITASTRHNIFLAPTARPCTGRFKLNQARASGRSPLHRPRLPQHAMDRHMHHQPLLADFHLLLILITSPQQVIRESP